MVSWEARADLAIFLLLSSGFVAVVVGTWLLTGSILFCLAEAGGYLVWIAVAFVVRALRGESPGEELVGPAGPLPSLPRRTAARIGAPLLPSDDEGEETDADGIAYDPDRAVHGGERPPD
jgi:hypothetical protein